MQMIAIKIQSFEKIDLIMDMINERKLKQAKYSSTGKKKEALFDKLLFTICIE